MNYIELINNFWRLDLEARFAPVNVHLYFYLLHVCNSLAWRNPFYHSNGQLTGALGISEKTLIGAKKRLQEMGLIEVESGDSRRKSSLYYLLNPCNNYSSSESRSGSNAGSRPRCIGSVSNKQKETKQNVKIKETTVSMHTPDELNTGDYKGDLPPSGPTILFEDETPLNDKFEENSAPEVIVERKKVA